MITLKPKIGLRSAVFFVMSVIVGGGVFKKIAPMAMELGSPWWVLLCWVLAGFISLAGALSTAEMVSMFPNSGGEYYYFQKVFGKFFAFLYGWASFTVTKTAGIAALAYIFAQSFNSLFPLPHPEIAIKLVAAVLIVILTAINYRGVSFAEKLSTVLTYLMLIGMVLFIVGGLFTTEGSIHNLTTTTSIHASPSGWSLIKALFVASLGAFWGYEGWNNITAIGEEVKNPKRNLPLALGLGTLVVIVLYTLLNLVFLYVLPIDYFIELNATPHKIAAVEVANVLSGSWGAILVAALILVTTLNSTNSSILMSARIIYAMARDQLFFKAAATVHPTYNTPTVALIIQGILGIGFIFSGSFDQLTDMLIFSSFLFYGSSALGVIIMRFRDPNIERPYKVHGYPWVPGIFVLFCLGLLITTIINQPREAFWGLVLIGSGIPIYLFLKKIN